MIRVERQYMHRETATLQQALRSGIMRNEDREFDSYCSKCTLHPNGGHTHSQAASPSGEESRAFSCSNDDGLRSGMSNVLLKEYSSFQSMSCALFLFAEWRSA